MASSQNPLKSHARNAQAAKMLGQNADKTHTPARTWTTWCYLGTSHVGPRVRCSSQLLEDPNTLAKRQQHGGCHGGCYELKLPTLPTQPTSQDSGLIQTVVNSPQVASCAHTPLVRVRDLMQTQLPNFL
eukprot:4440875-Amphidinium_carterae.2